MLATVSSHAAEPIAILPLFLQPASSSCACSFTAAEHFRHTAAMSSRRAPGSLGQSMVPFEHAQERLLLDRHHPREVPGGARLVRLVVSSSGGMALMTRMRRGFRSSGARRRTRDRSRLPPRVMSSEPSTNEGESQSLRSDPREPVDSTRDALIPRRPMRKGAFWVHLTAGVAAGVVIPGDGGDGRAARAAAAGPAVLAAAAARDALRGAPRAGGAPGPRPGPEPRRAAREPHDRCESADRALVGIGAATRSSTWTHVPARCAERARPVGGRSSRASHRLAPLAGGRGRGLRPPRAVTGASNAAFLFLSMSGAYLWCRSR